MFTYNLKYVRIYLLLIFILLNPLIVTAQNDGTLDTSFGNGGRVITLSTPANFIDRYDGATMLLNDGRIMTSVGKKANNQLVAKVFRYLSNGSLDMSWGQNGTITTSIPGVNDILRIYDIKVQPDGKIVIAGTMDTIIGSDPPISIGFLVRYLPNGAIDSSFGNQGFIYQFSLPANSNFPNRLNKLVVQQNRIITVSIDSPYSTRLQAYKISNGAIDTSWGNNGIQLHDFFPINNIATGIVDLKVQEDGKFLISSKNLIFRFLPSGELDSSFADNGHLTPLIADMTQSGFTYIDQPLSASLSIEILNNQKILVSGMGAHYSQYGGLGIVERYLPDGTLDSTFSHNGFSIVNYNTSNNQKYKQSMGWIASQNDESFIVSGAVKDTSVTGNGEVMFAMEKFTKDGIPKMDFGDEGVVITSPFISSNPIDKVSKIIIQSDSKILLIGTNVDTSSFSNTTLLMSRYNNTDKITGINKNNLTEKNFEMHPNPANNQLTVQVPQEGEIKIYNTMGQCVLNQEVNKGKHLISVGKLNKGIYFVKYRISPFQYYYKKLIKN